MHHADFMRLWAGQTVSQLGSRITRDGLPLLGVITLRASPAQMGLLSAIGSAPALLVGLVAGVWVDRLRRRPILIAADLLRAALLASIPIAALLGVLGVGQLYVVAALVGALTVLFDVAYVAYLPSLVERARVMEGNAKLTLSDSLAEMVGPGLAGVLVQTLTAPIAILVDALSFLVSVGSLALIRKPEPLPAPPEARQPLMRELAEGLRAVRDNHILRALAGTAGTFSFFGNFFAALYGLYAIRILGMSAAVLGLTIAAGGAGNLLGALVAERAVRRLGLGATLIGSLILGASAALLIPLARGPLTIAVGMMMAAQLFGDGLWSIYAINEVSLRQTIVPDLLLGRANASMELIASGLGPLGALLGGVLGGVLGIRATLFIAVAGRLLACGWLLASPVRGMRKPSSE